jgi:soluble lytic murein transglycosylase-like protein
VVPGVVPHYRASDPVIEIGRAMARSLATSIRFAAPAAGYVAFWVVLASASIPLPSGPVVVRPAACHVPGAAPAWTAFAHPVYDEIERRMREHRPAQRAQVARTILEEAGRAALDPLLVVAVIQIESGFDPRAVSPVGAAGLMQLLGPTMREELARWSLPRADPFDPVANVRAGVRYLDRMLGAFDDLELALMAYNAGPGRIRRHLRDGGVPERFLSYPRDVSRAHRRLSSALARAGVAPVAAGPRRAPARLESAHARHGLTARARRGDVLAPPAAPGGLPVMGPPAPIAAAVPAGSRRRDLGDT